MVFYLKIKFAVFNKHGIKFIGPSELISKMGDKIEAKRICKKIWVTYNKDLQGGVKIFLKQNLCDNIGYPVLIKAAGGGGGKR